MTVEPPPVGGFDFDVPILIIGAGACGLVAALSTTEHGGEVLVVEADAVPSGSTALSAGLIPAAGTKAHVANATPGAVSKKTAPPADGSRSLQQAAMRAG